MKKSLLIGTALAACTTAFAQTHISSLPGVSLRSAGIYDITSDLTLTANTVYILDNLTFVNDGVKLTIEEGAIIRGQPRTAPGAAENPGTLVVSRGAQIDAQGTASNPIIFTTAATPTGARWTSGAFLDANPKTAPLGPEAVINSSTEVTTNLWGSVILLGHAPTNLGAVEGGISGEGYIEGLTLTTEDTKYGGYNPNDNSGIMRYVSIRHTGDAVAEGQELQGLTLGGVGYGTLLEYIDIYMSGDDGIEIFGGNSSLKNFVIYGAQDDGLDLDQGYQGNCQFGLIIAPYTGSDSTAEWDGDDDITADGNNVSDTGGPFTNPTLANLTFMGTKGTAGSSATSYVVRARQGFGGNVINSICTAYTNSSIFRLDNTGTANAELSGYPSVLTEDRARGVLNFGGAPNVVEPSLTFAGWMFHNSASDTAASIASGGGSSVEAGIIGNTVGNSVNNQVIALAGAGNPQFAAIVDPSGNGVAGVYSNQKALDGLNPIPQGGNVSVASFGVPYGATFFDAVTYIGAFEPDLTKIAWTTGWTALNLRDILVDNAAAQDLL